jgi:hypothetical protein
MQTDGFWFKSSLFEIEPGEDKAINPGIYGKQLAEWLAGKLSAFGYDVEVINEDWGRCIMCTRDPVWLWVGCANMNLDFPEESESLPKKEEMVWHCFVVSEIPFWKRLFRRIDPEPLRKTLTEQVSSILSSESQINFVEEP